MGGPDGQGSGLTRRGLLAAGATAGAGLALGSRGARAQGAPPILRTAFGDMPDGEGWGARWVCPGVANLRIAGGVGVLEAGTDVFPSDPRPVCFAIDARIRDGSVRAVIADAGSACGVVLRRTSPRDYYAAVFESDLSLLQIVRRTGTDLVTLAQTPAVAGLGGTTLELTATGAGPTALVATLTGAAGAVFRVGASDGRPELQEPGDAGALGQARTLFPSAGPPVFPALGNVHLLPYGVQEGEAFIASPLGQEVIIRTIRDESTVTFREIAVSSAETPRPTPAGVIAATTGLPRVGGARLHVASDLRAQVVIETADSPRFERSVRAATGKTGDFDAFTANVHGLPPGARAYWRATLHRAGTATTGPVRSFPVLPAAGDATRTTIAIAACAAQFGPLFDDLARLQPDVFIWQGDLNYPDTVGPLAQTMTGYAGIWREFLANPRLAPVLERSAFATMRDDHDYARQDSNSTTIPHDPWGIHPWDALMGEGIGYSFSAGQADVWVLDQRRFKSDPTAPDDAAKTLLGARQREWLLTGLRSSSAPFKVICSPCTVFMRSNSRDGNWATGFNTERDQILRHIDREVSGRVIFFTGDTHLTGVYDHDGRYEARACPLGIPVPNDITISDPRAAEKLRSAPGVTYADDRCHYAILEVHGDATTATLEISLRREDGTTPYRKTLTQAIPPTTFQVAMDGRPADGRLRARTTLGRPGFVRLRATLERWLSGRRSTSRIAERVVRIDHAGTRRFVLRLSRGGRAALRHPGRLRLTLTGRYRDPARGTIVRRARRLLRR